MINVTKTYLPDKEKYLSYINMIYDNGWVTNNGPLEKLLEKKLANYLGVKELILVANGTVALEIAYRALDIQGSAITTPFSFVATTSSLVTNKITPIFSDINSETLNIDENKIEINIQKDTTAIVPVHVYGNTCNVELIDQISKKHNLKVVYDAAHAFGVKYKGGSVLNYGDISTLSFHATKLFHSIEGGALILNDVSLTNKVRRLINFGIENEESIPEIGINAKMNEFEAAMGLCMLDEMEAIANSRHRVFELYIKSLDGIVGFQKADKHCTLNNSYFPIILSSEKDLLKVKKALNYHKIFPRRYFYPSLDTLSYISPKQYCHISRDISKRILCLPMYADLEETTQMLIIKTIISVL